jgi:hypothetical protein
MSELDAIRCSRAEELLFERAESLELRRHLDGCARCQSLAARLDAAAEPPEEWTGSLLQRLAGSACERARELLFGEPSSEEEVLLEEHLLHCAACAELRRADGWARRWLPQLAALEPGEAFTHDVLRRTSAAPARRRFVRSRRLGRYLQRPQAPMELAYAFAVACVLLIALPGAPFGGLPGATLQWLRGEEQGAPRGAGWAEATLVPAAAFPARAVVRGAALTGALGDGISLRAGQVSWAADAFGGHAREFGAAVTERSWEELRPVLSEMRCDMHLMLRGASGRLKSPDERC